MSNKQIAAHLGLSARTIEDRFSELRKRTGARTQGELLACAAAVGLVQPAVAAVTESDSASGQRTRDSAKKRSALNASRRHQHLVDADVPGTRNADKVRPSERNDEPRAPRVRRTDTAHTQERVTTHGPGLRENASAIQWVLHTIALGQAGSYPHNGPIPSAPDLLDDLREVRREREWLDHAERVLIDEARHRGVTWQKIGRALGVRSAQAAQQRRKRLGDLPNGPVGLGTL